MTNACIAKFLMHPLEDGKTTICVECSDNNGIGVPKYGSSSIVKPVSIKQALALDYDLTYLILQEFYKLLLSRMIV